MIHKSLFKLLSLIVILSAISCDSIKYNSIAAIEEDCEVIQDKEILDENNLPCNYQEVYRYNDIIYTVCVCCACFKCSPPTDCDGNILFACLNADWDEFYSNADYLYAVSE